MRRLSVRRVLLVLVLVLVVVPAGLVSIGTQVALGFGLLGAAQTTRAMEGDSGSGLERGTRLLAASGSLLEATWSNPTSYLLQYNPLTLGTVDDIRSLAGVAGRGTSALPPAAALATAAVGFGGMPALYDGSTVDLDQLPGLVEPSAALAESLGGLETALAQVPTTGLIGRQVGPRAQELVTPVADATEAATALAAAMPGLPEALGASGPKEYLLAILNDAELFGSGGAPLTVMQLEARGGTITTVASGHVSEATPNTRVRWEHAGQLPWYRAGRKYPFVNSNFHPDFPTAATDMSRAWAAMGLPELDGVVTVDVAALASMLAQTGPVFTEGYGEVNADNVLQKLLVDAYRDYEGEAGVARRHKLNDELNAALAERFTDPASVRDVLRGLLEAIPPRHVQAAFTSPELQSAAITFGATGALSDQPGDLIGVYSQSAPNKLSVFQDRRIRQQVILNDRGGATVRRTVSFTNAVPESVPGWETIWAGYTALRARNRVAYRAPADATDLSVEVREVRGDGPLPDTSAVPSKVGPYPDGCGGQVLWQGQETAPRATSTVVMKYTIPDGTFTDHAYRVAADPQALTIPATLRIEVTAAPGTSLPDTPGWTTSDAGLVWEGTLDRTVDLEVG